MEFYKAKGMRSLSLRRSPEAARNNSVVSLDGGGKAMISIHKSPSSKKGMLHNNSSEASAVRQTPSIAGGRLRVFSSDSALNIISSTDHETSKFTTPSTSTPAGLEAKLKKPIFKMHRIQQRDEFI